MPIPKKLSLWLHGLIGAVTTGFANGVLLVTANAAFDLFKDQKSLWGAVALSTLVSTASYLKQSPIPLDDSLEEPAPNPTINP